LVIHPGFNGKLCGAVAVEPKSIKLVEAPEKTSPMVGAAGRSMTLNITATKKE
jgi:hypothetical protein